MKFKKFSIDVYEKPVDQPRVPKLHISLISVALSHHVSRPYALPSTKAAPGSLGFAYKGYRIVSWSDTEEKLIETLKGSSITKVGSSLRTGAITIENASTKAGKIKVDSEVASGANLMVSNVLRGKFVKILKLN